MVVTFTTSQLLVSIFVVFVAIFTSSVWEITPYLCSNFSYLDPNPPYQTPNINAPCVSNWLYLRILTRILISSPLGDVIARHILKKNGLSELLELANHIQQIDSSSPVTTTTSKDSIDYNSGNQYGLGEPMIRLSEEEYMWHVSSVQKTSKIKEKLFPSYTTTTTTTTTTNAKERDNKNRLPKMKYNSIRDYQQSYKSKRTTPLKVIEKLFDFIETVDKHKLHSIQQVDYDVAINAAKESTKRWEDNKPISIWDGIPILVKGDLRIKGLHHTDGRKLQTDNSDIATFDDCIVSKFRHAGAIVVGTTILHELGLQPTGFNPWYGGPLNPYNSLYFSGGSSSGSAVAVATNMVPVAIGVDGGGSIRIPAAWSGTVGLAPGYGRIQSSKEASNIFSITKLGPLTNNVEDAAEALLLLAGGQQLTNADYRETEETRERSENGIYSFLYGGKGPPPSHLVPRWWKMNEWDDVDSNKNTIVRIGIFKDWISDRPSGSGAGNTSKDDAVYKALQKALRTLTSKNNDGASDNNNGLSPMALTSQYTTVDFALPHMDIMAFTHVIIISTAFSFSAANEMFKGSSTYGDKRRELQPASMIQVKLGQQFTAMELIAAQRIRAFAIEQFRMILSEKADVILTPTTGMTALRRPVGSDVLGFTDSNLFMQMMRYVWPGNLLGLPSIAIPAGVDSHGMPISLQVYCTHWHEADCIAVGRDIERVFKSELPMPPSDVFANLLED